MTLAAACGGGASNPDGGADASPLPDAGADPLFDDPRGVVTIAELSLAGSTYGVATAELASAPAGAVYTTIMEAGACRLRAYEAGFCDPPCLDGLCTSDDECVPWATRQSGGTIAVTGAKVALSLVPDAYGYYQATPWDLPGDLFDDGAPIAVSAPGAAFPAFDLQAGGTAAIDPQLAGELGDELQLADGADNAVTWSAAAPGARVRLIVRSPTVAHGLPSTRLIECDAPDAGSIEIPQAIVEAFPAMPRSEICVGRDCPMSTILRYTRAADTDVVLRVGSRVDFFVSHGQPM